MIGFIKEMFCKDGLKLWNSQKCLLSTEDDMEEVAKDLVTFYGFQNLILKVNF